MREAKAKLKAETEMQRKIMNDVKQKHAEIMRLESRQKQIQSQIKTQKDKGYSPRTSKRMLEQEHKQNENAVYRLENDIRNLEETKSSTVKEWKA